MIIYIVGAVITLIIGMNSTKEDSIKKDDVVNMFIAVVFWPITLLGLLFGLIEKLLKGG